MQKWQTVGSAVEIERQQKVHRVVNYKQQNEIAFY
jgi:hypothetical protein